LNIIQEDFIQLTDFFSGRYRQNLCEIVSEQGALFLSTDEEADYSQLDENGRRAFLSERVSTRLNPLWYLIVSLSKVLQEGEHPIPVEDAYWLGLVDEVIGRSLPTIRAIREAAANSPKKTSPLPA
jgi:hypothetical protein